MENRERRQETRESVQELYYTINRNSKKREWRKLRSGNDQKIIVNKKISMTEGHIVAD